MPPPLRLNAVLEPPNGMPKRLGGDATSGRDVLAGLSFSDTIPGGFESCDFTLLRDPEGLNPELAELTNCRIEGPGRDLAWEGRVESVPQTTSGTREISPSLVGWQAALEDDQTATQVYLDRLLDNWQAMTSARAKQVYTAGVDVISDVTTEADSYTGAPGLKFDADGEWAAARFCEGYYDSRSLLDTIYFSFSHRNMAATYQFYAAGADDWAGNGGINSADLITAGSTATVPVTGNTSFSFGSSGKRIASFSMQYYGAVTSGSTDRDIRLSNVLLVGKTGLTLRGTFPTAGLYASDIIEHAVRTWAPNLARSIDPTGWIIQQAAFIEETTAAEIVRFANAYHLCDWGVWDDKTFHYYQRGDRGRKWRARVGDSNLQEAGPQVDRMWNGVVVRYTDVDGRGYSVGPVGSHADYTTSTLQDADPENPANLSGLRRWVLLDVGQTMTRADAVEVGRRFLIESAQLNRSGSAQLVGYAWDEKGVCRPAWQVRSGDYISFIDASDSSYRRIVRKTYDHDNYTSSIDLDAPPAGLDALLERLGADLVPLGLT